MSKGVRGAAVAEKRLFKKASKLPLGRKHISSFHSSEQIWQLGDGPTTETHISVKGTLNISSI